LLALATALSAQELPPVLEASFEVASLKRTLDGGPNVLVIDRVERPTDQ
jgi:hypothetical protein